MKINLKKISYRNLLSVGANPVTIDNLASHHTTLITGTNGASKSTLIEAIIFALYGRPYRNINKNQLINSVNKKNCVVELWFDIDGKKEYYIKRGIKPNVFIIKEDDVELEEEAGVRDFQKILETEILKMSYKTAKQIVALGTAGFTPFMQLRTHERREIIDDLLDLEVFSKMSENNKKLSDSINQSFDKVNTSIEYNSREIDIRKKYVSESKRDKTKQIDAVKEKIDHLYESIANSEATIVKKQDDINKLESALNPFSKEELGKLLTDKTTAELNIKNIQKGVRFFEEHCKCPTCKQKIDQEFISSKILQYTNELNDATRDLEAINSSIERLEQIKLRNLKIQTKKQHIETAISELRHHIKVWTEGCAKYELEIEKLKDDHASIDVTDLDLLIEQSKQLVKDKKILSSKKYCHNIISNLLKDNGIKARIINQYIPAINQLINNYLGIMDANYKFELDSEFNEKILSRGREEFSYMSFSQGEKLRIDLAILFTWRELIKLKNAASFNILIMDEIMDSAADQDGVDAIMKIIADLKDNVFIISHNDKIDTTLFDNHIKMIKVGNFSCIEKHV